LIPNAAVLPDPLPAKRMQAPAISVRVPPLRID
jgi:hypothetical protein